MVKNNMSDEKKESQKLEKEFRDFQKEWKKFLTNDFHHLVVNVDTLIKQNAKQHNEMQQGMEIMLKNMGTINQQIKTELELNERIITLFKKEH
jgi:hypothetical protein